MIVFLLDDEEEWGEPDHPPISSSTVTSIKVKSTSCTAPAGVTIYESEKRSICLVKRAERGGLMTRDTHFNL